MQHIIVFVILATAIAHLVKKIIKRTSNKCQDTHCCGCPLAKECCKKKKRRNLK